METYDDVFSVPVKDNFLLHAPLRHLHALIDANAALAICQWLNGGQNNVHPAVQPLIHELQTVAFQHPSNNSGRQPDPLFLGIIPTRGCNMGCGYCDFAVPNRENPAMSLETAKAAVDAYCRLIQKQGKSHLEIQFFGGEPFFAAGVIDFIVGYAHSQARQRGWRVSFEVTTNGLYSERRARWIASHFGAVVLSLDGPADIQDLHRPAPNGQGTFDIVKRNAQIFSEGECELIVRACVTEATAPRLPEIAHWIRRSFRPSTVCLESITQSPFSQASGFQVPDPFVFATYFDQAGSILAAAGIRTVLSTAELQQNQASFCPVGKDALIVSPDGSIDACYLLPESWQDAGKDMHLGTLDLAEARFAIDAQALDEVRQNSVYQHSLCEACFCRYHCAGGCHVQHVSSGPPGAYDDLCTLTRLVTAVKLLRSLGQDNLAGEWLQDREAMQHTAGRITDRLLDLEMPL